MEYGYSKYFTKLAMTKTMFFTDVYVNKSNVIASSCWNFKYELKMNYSLQEKIKMVYAIGESDGNCFLASRIYKQKYPDRRHPDSRVFERIKHQFEETGTIIDGKSERYQSVTNEEACFNVALNLVENPHSSTRSISREMGISQTSVSRMVRKLKFHPYHMQLLQELTERDFERRMRFCQWGLEKIDQDVNFFNNVIFTDEATFHSNGNVNRHNMHYYATENPHFIRCEDRQHRWSLNVWGGIFNETVIGPYFFDEHLNGTNYLAFLRGPFQDFLDNFPLAVIQRAWLQQDGAPAHYSVTVRQFLDVEFDGKWIGRGGPIEWPRRSPYLTKMDLFLWGYVKGIIYQTSPTTQEDMKNRIRRAFREIPIEMLRCVEQSFRHRLRTCVVQNGRHIENLM